MAGIFLTRAPSRSPVVKFFGVSIPALTTLAVDAVDFTDHVTAKWLVTLVNSTDTKIQSYEVVANYLTGKANPSYTVYSLIGDKIKNKAEVVISGGDLTLEIENKEAVTLTADVLRFDLSA